MLLSSWCLPSKLKRLSSRSSTKNGLMGRTQQILSSRFNFVSLVTCFWVFNPFQSVGLRHAECINITSCYKHALYFLRPPQRKSEFLLILWVASCSLNSITHALNICFFMKDSTHVTNMRSLILISRWNLSLRTSSNQKGIGTNSHDSQESLTHTISR